VVPAAPRYHPLLLAALAELDDRRQPIAEVCRKVGVVAEALGLPRPSYVHVRRRVHERRTREDVELARRAAVRGIIADVASDVVAGRFVDPYEVAGRVSAADEGARSSELQAPSQGGEA
jgi:hypothetical protein